MVASKHAYSAFFMLVPTEIAKNAREHALFVTFSDVMSDVRCSEIIKIYTTAEEPQNRRGFWRSQVTKNTGYC